MDTRVATASASGSSSDAAAILVRELSTKLGQAIEPALVVVFASTLQPLAEVMPVFRASFPRSVLLGASTAGELTEAGDTKGSVAAFALAGDYRVFGGMADGVKADPESAVKRATALLPTHVEGFPHQTGLILIDALSGHGEAITLLAATLLGLDVPLAGGAAGDDLAMKATHVALGSTVAEDAVVIVRIFSTTPLAVGVSHGHTPLSEPLMVTRATGNVVHEVNGRPAWDVWREETNARAAQEGVDPADGETAYLLRYEAALAAGQSYKIRAPLSRLPDGSLSFACEIPTGAVIRITEGSPPAQFESARRAARAARAKLGGRDVAGALVFDCICRKLVLGDVFAEAVRAMSHELGNAPLAGFETYGEIAFDSGDLSGFHNTTSVVLAFPK